MSAAMFASVRPSWENRDGADQRANAARLLTHSLDSDEEGLAMQATRDDCQTCDPASYQEYALRSYIDANPSESVLPWIWFYPTCGTPNCVTYRHMRLNAPTRIAYPQLVCIYCGMPGGTKDHLLPRGYTGDAQRRYVAIVPACGQCNSFISDRCDYRVSVRREFAHTAIRKRYAKALTPVVDYRQFTGQLRQYVKAAHAKQDVVLARLAWPWDPDYDLRAFQKSGIEDPYALGLI